ncbi:MAG: long-chain fatty acid--CoA ligase [Bacteroidales bacterium]
MKRIFDLLPHIKRNYNEVDTVLAGKEDGKWVKYNIDQYITITNSISFGLLKLGIQKGDKIATISNNRPEWNFLDIAIQQVGAIHVPIYPTISDSDYRYILNHAEVKYGFVAGKELLKRIEHIIPEIKSLQGIYTFKHIDNVPHLNELIELGNKNQQKEKLERAKGSVSEDDISTMIYTSGTTGFPKGVMLSHKNILSNVEGLQPVSPTLAGDKVISYLPLCHIYERTLNLMFQSMGCTVYYAENLARIVDNMQEIKPHAMATVPRLLEKIYDRIIMKGRKLTGIKKVLFFWAVNLGLKYEFYGKNGSFYELQLKLARKLVFNKWKIVMGGEFKVIVSGGAALQPRLMRIFNAAGIPLVSGYGLSEHSPVVSTTTLADGEQRIGSVGLALKNVNIKIGDDGEILVKSSSVMKGYYKSPEQTNEVISKDGWLHTGDIGMLEDDKFLKITGRKKEIFKTSNGKYISPVLLENKLKESPFIDSLVVLGENQKFAAALITPNFDHLKSWCKIKNIPYTNNQEMVLNKSIIMRFKKEVDHYNKTFGATEKINRFKLLNNEWTIKSGELTPNLKLRRDFIMKKYKEEVFGLFS